MKIKSLIGSHDVTVDKIYHVDAYEYEYGTAWIKDDIGDEYPMLKGEYEVVDEE